MFVRVCIGMGIKKKIEIKSELRSVARLSGIYIPVRVLLPLKSLQRLTFLSQTYMYCDDIVWTNIYFFTS